MALVASRSYVLFETELAVELTVLLDETDVLQLALAGRVNANEMLRAPDTTERSYERTPKQTTRSI